jgi:rubrerythrin
MDGGFVWECPRCGEMVEDDDICPFCGEIYQPVENEK